MRGRMLLRCISIQTMPYSLQSKLITTLYLFLVSLLLKKVRLYVVYEFGHGRNISSTSLEFELSEVVDESDYFIFSYFAVFVSFV